MIMEFIMLSFKEMAVKLKCNVNCDFPDDFPISDELKLGFSNIEIRDGLKGLSNLLIQVFDVLITEASNFSSHEKNTVNSRGHTNIYPEMKNLLTFLYCIGYCGKLDKTSEYLVFDGKKLNDFYKKTRGNKPLDYMHLLHDAGLDFSSAIDEKSFILAKAGSVEVCFPDDRNALIGLKVLANATSRINREPYMADVMFTFARCDYHVLSKTKTYIYEINEVTGFLPEDMRKYYIDLHNHLIANNCKYESKINMNEYQFSYTSKHKKAKIFSIHISMDHSYVKLNSKLITENPDLLTDAPESIKTAVKNGWDCAKKNDPNACNPKCAGKALIFNLAGTEFFKCWILNFNLPVNEKNERDYINIWLNKELA